MTEERIVTTEPFGGSGGTNTKATIIREAEQRRSSSAGWLFALMLVANAILGFYLLTQTSSTGFEKDNTMAGVGHEVGEVADRDRRAIDNADDGVGNL